MFLLDTNVVSELLHPSCAPAVKTWIKNHPPTDLYFSAISEAELRYGVAILPAGRRQTVLSSAIEEILREDFNRRLLPFDSSAARAYAEIAAMRRFAGRPVKPIDSQIAAIARSRNMAVVTRNVRDFEGVGIEVIDPWGAT